jgi:carbamoyl-phosphate synthase large subunit
MASSARLPRQLLLQSRRVASASSFTARSTRSFRTQQWSSPRLPIAAAKTSRASYQSFRQISNTAAKLGAANATQEAPNAQAYLNSGVIAGARDLVDVKKVLVIGSGGLSIGQAGEFDYSGQLHFNPLLFALQSRFGCQIELWIHWIPRMTHRPPFTKCAKLRNLENH